MRPIVLDKRVKFRDPHLNHSQEIAPDAIGGGILDGLFEITSGRKKIVTSYPVWLESRSVRMSNMVILGQTVFEIFERLTL